MRITNLAVSYRTSVVVMTIILAVIGLASYISIPKESTPSIEIPVIVVTTIYPGASPDDVESLITQEVESEIQDVNGIKEIRSTSTEGVSTIIVEFNTDVSIDDAYQKIRDKVSVAKPDLPQDIEEPIISEIDTQEFPIVTINLAAGYSLARLKDVAEDLVDEIETIPSILEVDLIGGLEREVQVNVDRSKLQGYNLAFFDIINAIQQENVTLPGGSINVDRFDYLVRVSGEFESPEEIKDLVVKVPDRAPGMGKASPIYIRDVADVRFGFKERSSYSRLEVLQYEDENDNLYQVAEDEVETLQVISLNVKKRAGENIIEAVEAVNEKLEAFPLPNGTEVVITGDMSEMVRALVEDLENNIISGLIFVVSVLFFFLGIRNSFLVGIAIPLSMGISFAVFSALGYALNFIMLFSLIIALGMLVDNAIVIVENIYRYREEGHGRFEAAKLATSEVGGAVVASTATTVAVFVPMLFWPGVIGKFMGYLPITLIVTLVSSLFVAIVINPVISGIFVRLEEEEKKKLGRATKIAGVAVLVLVGVIIGLVNLTTLFVILGGAAVIYPVHRYVLNPIALRFARSTLPRIYNKYRNFLDWMLERDYTYKRALLRNTLVLSSFTIGIVLAVAGQLLGQVGTEVSGQIPFSAAGLLLLVPGVILLVFGVLGILFHTAETVFAGGRASAKAGFVLGGVMAVFAGLISWSTGELNPQLLVTLFFLPAVLIIVGLLGMLRKSGRPIVLTDNRAKLLNASLGVLFIIFGLYAVAPTGVEFFPETDPTQVRVIVEGVQGTTVETSNRNAAEAERRLNNLMDTWPNARRNVKNMLVNVGIGGDVLFGGGASGPERSSVTLNLVDYADRSEPSRATLARIRDEMQGIPGTEIEVEQDENGPPTGAPVNIEVSGEDFDEIVRITSEIKARLLEGAETGDIPGLVDIRDNLNTGRPEMAVHIDPERAARFGLDVFSIASTIRTAVNGTEAGTFRDGEDEYDITVRLEEVDRNNLESLKNLTILTEGNQVPLAAVADFRLESGLGSITRLDLSRVATIEGGTAPGYSGPEVLATVQGRLSDYVESLPTGYAVAYTGENEEQNEAFGFLGTALVIGLALIFFIMVAQFNSVAAPFIIMIAVGLSFIGVLLGLILTRSPFGLMTFIGTISLAGIVVNNNIVLIDYVMQLRDRGYSKHDAIVEAGATRFRPVILTALTTVLGLIPLTFGINIDFVGLLTSFDPAFSIGSDNTQFWGPMGTTIIAGLLFATFLTLVIIPVIYSIFDSLSDRLSVVFASKSPIVDEPAGAEPESVDGSEPFDVGGNGAPKPADKPIER